VAVVILNWNGRKYLEQFLPYLIQTTYKQMEIVVADNGSTDDSVEFLSTQYPQVVNILNKENLGFANGYNKALENVSADYYVLLNSDAEVTPGWLEPMIELLEINKTIGACQPKLLNWNERDSFEYAGGAGGWLDAYGYPFCRGRIFDHCEKDLGQYDEVAPVFWASGAALFIRADLFHQVGGFDGYFFAHQEEIDLCWRIQRAGHSVYACPSSVVYHVGGGTLPKGNARKVFLNFRNNLIMLYKNLPWGQKIWKIPYRILLDSISAWKNVPAGELSYFGAVVKAHLAFVRWILLHPWKNLPYSRDTQKLNGLYRGNIVWEHFIKGKKLFSEIVKPLIFATQQ
jgi:GT2 family glycosyltransferase